MQRAYRPFKNRVLIISNLSLRLIENIFPIRLNNIYSFLFALQPNVQNLGALKQITDTKRRRKTNIITKYKDCS